MRYCLLELWNYYELSALRTLSIVSNVHIHVRSYIEAGAYRGKFNVVQKGGKKISTTIRCGRMEIEGEANDAVYDHRTNS